MSTACRWQGPEAIERISRLQPGGQLLVGRDPGNAVDPGAVGVYADAGGPMIGYVPRYLAGDVGQLLEPCCPDYVGLFVERVNRDAPLQQRVLCRMRACWPEGFQPCRGAEFRPILEDVSSPCRA